MFCETSVPVLLLLSPISFLSSNSMVSSSKFCWENKRLRGRD
ncbi:hypothetical protein OIU84_016456 [Salix udensis]|uniref:Uncharacterized protein n=1 Tax=Salix udensis TaxID=889485 RepID=A0AAD6JAC1_9ROSI|nr:hypothetical protein OIU84_016456 [Salix udensis]